MPNYSHDKADIFRKLCEIQSFENTEVENERR